MSQVTYKGLNFSLAFKEFHPMLLIALWATDPFLKTYQRITGTDVGFIYEVVDSELTGYMQTEAPEMIRDSIKGRLSVEWLDKELINFEDQFAKLKSLIEPARLRDYSREELIALFQSLYETTAEIYPYSNAFYLLSVEIEKDILEKLGQTRTADESAQILAQLSKPLKPTSLMRYFAEIEALAGKIKSAHGNIDAAGMLALLETDTELRSALQALSKEYFCLTSLNGEERTVESIIPDIVARMAQREPEQAIATPPEIEKEIALLHTMIYFKDEISTFIIPYVYHGLKRQWKAAAAELNISEKEMEQLLFQEVIGELKNPQPLAELIQKRNQGSFIFHAPFKSAEITDGKDALDIIASLALQNAAVDYSSVTEIKGKTGAPGKVRGIVQRIMHSNEIQSFKEGHVLVTVYTAPEFVPAMKKAIAIVTDTGGITCHAAIVSRELHKPCVVGAKIATAALKDGDEVEVDADKGIVRILKR